MTNQAIGWEAGRDALDFPKRFKKAFGRAPRILHIGNVANYAYLNAKIQRAHGIDAHCIDPNFYHIMASPEWLEAPISGDHGDDFAPKWSRVDLGGYKRPDWFVQGDEDLAFRYLAAYVSGQTKEAHSLLRQLEMHRRVYTNDTPLPATFWQGLMSGQSPFARGVRKWGKHFLLRGKARSLPSAPSSVAAPNFEVAPPPEVLHYALNAARFRPLLEHYDIIQGYTIQSIYPAAAELPNFVSYELGTIRGLPFEDSPMGRLTRWVYLMSPEVFVTNIDCLEPAARLGLQRERTNKALHAFDLDEAVNFARSWSEQLETEPPVFYAPARQHWKEGNTSILKGNDVALRGAALLKQRGKKFKLVLSEWGSEVDLSKALIQDLGIGDYVEWSRPLPRHNLWPTYMRACAVIDQFKSPAFGGVSLEAMALGRRLITAYDHTFGEEYFSSAPPILNCRTPEAVADAMEYCIDDPYDSQNKGPQAQQWMLREHSVERQLRDQYEVYERLLGRLRYVSNRWVKPQPAD